MVDRLVLINGLPGSGKTTLATALAQHLRVPLIAKDAIKEAVADVVGAAAWSALGAAAMDMAWSLAASIPGTVLLEAWWFKPRDLSFVEAGLNRCGSPTVVEVWCDAPAHLAKDRYEARDRHRIHDDQQRLAGTWAQWAAGAEPLRVGSLLRVRTDRPVDIADVARTVVDAFSGADHSTL